MEENVQTPQASLSAKPKTFLSLAADYLIAPDSESTDLMDDAALFLECACETITTVASSLESERGAAVGNSKSAAVVLYGACRFLEMTLSNVSAVNRRLVAAGKPKDEAHTQERGAGQAKQAG